MRLHMLPRSLQGVLTAPAFLVVLLILLSLSSRLEKEPSSTFFAAAATLQETEFVAVDVGTAWLKVAALRRLTTLEADDGDNSPLALERKKRAAPSVYGGGGAPKSTAEETLSLKQFITTDHRIEIVLNDQANRKSPPCVAFRYFPNMLQNKGEAASTYYTVERFLSEQAQVLAPRMPSQVVCSPTLLLEDTYNAAPQPGAKEALCDSNKTFAFCLPTEKGERGVRDAFFPHKLGGDAAAAQHDGDRFSPEELTSMLLAFAAAKAEHEDLDRNRLFFSELLQVERQQDAATAAAAAQEDAKKRKKEAKQEEMVPNRVHRVALALPASASLSYRQALLDAATLAGLHVPLMTLASSGAAAQLALLRGEELFSGATSSSITEGPKAKYVMLYDMGSRLTEVSVWAFSTAHDGGSGLFSPHSNKKGRGGRHHVHQVALEVHPSLGGESFDQCIAQYWDRTFFDNRILSPAASNSGTTAADHVKRQKEILSLLRGAQRAREMLSAIKEAAITVEGLSPGSSSSSSSNNNIGGSPAGDSQKAVFTTVLQRDTFEKECAHLFHEAVAVRDAALRSAGATLQQQQEAATLTMKSLSRFEVVGGTTRMPKLLQDLSSGYTAAATVGVVDRTLNGDEAAVLGTAHLTAVALGQLSASAPLSFQLHPYLGYNIGYVLTPAGGGGSSGSSSSSATTTRRQDSAPRTLFAAKQTYLPATKTIHLALNDTTSGAGPHGPLLLTLLSPPEEATLATTAEGEAVELRVTPRSYLKHYEVHALRETVGTATARAAKECPGTFTTVSKIKIRNSEKKEEVEAGGAATSVQWLVRKEKCTMRPNATEVYLEVRVTESGFPMLQKSFLKVGFEKTITEVVERVVEHIQVQVEQPDAPEAEPPKEADQAEDSTASQKGEEEAEKGEEEEGGDDSGEDAETGVTHEDTGVEEGKERKEEEKGKKEEAPIAGATEDGHQNTSTTIQHIVRVLPLRSEMIDSCQVLPGQKAAPPCPSLHVRVVAPEGTPTRTMLLTREEKVASRQTMLQLDELDRERLRKSSLRNKIETVLLHIKTSDFWYSAKKKEEEGSAASEAVRTWREEVLALADWLEDEGEEAGMTELEGAMAKTKAAASQLAAWEREQRAETSST